MDSGKENLHLNEVRKITASDITERIIDIDSKKYSVVIKVSDLSNNDRPYYICKKEDLHNNSTFNVLTQISNPDSNRIEIWKHKDKQDIIIPRQKNELIELV